MVKTLTTLVLVLALLAAACRPNLLPDTPTVGSAAVAPLVEPEEQPPPQPQAISTPTPTRRPIPTPFPADIKPYEGPDPRGWGLPQFSDGSYMRRGDPIPRPPVPVPTEQEKARAIEVALAQPAIKDALAGKKYFIIPIRDFTSWAPPGVRERIQEIERMDKKDFLVREEELRRLKESPWQRALHVAFRSYADNLEHTVFLSVPDFKVLETAVGVKAHRWSPYKEEIDIALKIALADPLVQAKLAGRSVKQAGASTTALRGPDKHYWIGLAFSLAPSGRVEAIVDMVEEKVLEAARVSW
ncbi:MAG: hypothetical protein HY671_10710 [Chloroflexi bacterium]|nr:hypothetical protein [Chloroflexota bacterium]